MLNNKLFLKKIGIFILEITKTVLISLAIIVPIRYFLIQPFYVKGASMEPNFYDNEYLIINEIGYRLGDPERGDIIVFKYPGDKKQYYIKRVIGLPGERIIISSGKITIQNKDNPYGFVLSENYLDEDNNITAGEYNIILQDDDYYVLGDNRSASSDSRYFGPVKKDLIIGKAWIRGWPLSKVGVVGGAEY